MKKEIVALVIVIPSIIFFSATIDLNNLDNYQNQYIPPYISKDNTPNDNPITDEGATLGRILFYDKNLSVENTISCGTCHIQEFAFSDTSNVSSGINGNQTPRHSMRLINTRFGDEEKFRWDESALTLEKQMTIPIKAETEMGFSGVNGMPDFNDLVLKLNAIPYYPDLFNYVFGDPLINKVRIQKALAQFVRSIQSFDSKYDIGRAQVLNDLDPFPNFTNAENIGKELFINSFEWIEDTITVADVPGDPGGTFNVAKRINGGFNCATCHVPPEFSIDPNSLNNAFVRPPSNNPTDPSWLDGTRSPTLRDLIQSDGVTLNGGMFHSGQAYFLMDIFGHYEFRRLDTVDNTNLDPRLTRISPMSGEKIGILLNSTAVERQRINAFLATLTGVDVYTNEMWSDPFDSLGNISVTGLPVLTSTSVISETNEIELYYNIRKEEYILIGPANIYNIEILDMTGQRLISYYLKGSNQSIQLPSLSIGVYIVKILDQSNNLAKLKKIIIK